MSNKRADQAARLALFDNPTGYEEKHIGNQWFVKHFNGNTGKWQVAVYSEESFGRYKAYSKNPQPSSDMWYCVRCDEPLGYTPNPLHKCKSSMATFPMD